MNYKIPLAVLSAILLISCSSNESTYDYPEFKVVYEKEFDIISDDLLFSRIHDLYVYKDYIVVLASDLVSGQCVHIFDKCGTPIQSILHYGNGPKETIWGITQSDLNFSTGILSLCDFSRDMILCVDLDDVGAIGTDAITQHEYNFDLKMRRCNILCDGSKLVQWTITPENAEHALRMTLSETDTTYVYDEFPLEMSQLCSDVYLNSYSCVSPDASHLAVGTSYGAILELFDLTSGITSKKICMYTEPVLDYQGKNYSLTNTAIGFIDLYATNSYIYTAFDGINTIKNPEVLRNIAVFDWQGRAKTLFKTDMRVERLCFDESENTIYACVQNDIGNMYLAKLVVQ